MWFWSMVLVLKLALKSPLAAQPLTSYFRQGMRQGQGNPGRARRRPQAASGKGEIGIVYFKRNQNRETANPPTRRELIKLKTHTQTTKTKKVSPWLPRVRGLDGEEEQADEKERGRELEVQGRGPKLAIELISSHAPGR